jgi:hypothetical protein
MMFPLNISRSAESIPIGATKNRLNRNFRRNIIIIMAMMTKIMETIVPSTVLSALHA